MTVVVTGEVGPGALTTVRPPIVSVSPSSCVTVNVWPLVTETRPVKFSKVPTLKLSIKLASVPAVFSTMLNALLDANQAPTVALVPLKLKGDSTSNVTSAVVNGTFAGIAFCEVASGTCQSEPLIVFALAKPGDAITAMMLAKKSALLMDFTPTKDAKKKGVTKMLP